MRQRNQNISLNPNVALVPPGFEAVVRDQRRVGIANVLDETEARTMALPRMGLDIKKIVNEIFKGVQPVPSVSVTQVQSQNVECDHQSSSANVVGDQMEEKTMSLPNVISGFEKQVTDEAIQSVQDVRPMDETEELWRPNDEAAGTSRILKVYTRRKRPNDEAGTKRILKVYTRKKRPNNEAGRILKVYTRKKRPNDEAGTKRILKVYTRKKWHGGPRLNQQGNEKDNTVAEKADKVSKQ